MGPRRPLRKLTSLLQVPPEFTGDFRRFRRAQLLNFFLILSDLDHFKRVNDTYGHHIGDSVLKEYAAIISERKRSTDHLSRWGGEEFVLILPNTKLVEAETVVRALIDEVRRHRFKDVRGIIVSMGVGGFNDRTNRVDFFKAIDRALYEAKQQGTWNSLADGSFRQPARCIVNRLFYLFRKKPL